MRRDYSARIIYYRAAAVFVERRRRVLAFAALRAVTGNEEKYRLATLAKRARLVGMRRADYRAYRAVAMLAYLIRAPFGDEIADAFIQQLAALGL